MKGVFEASTKLLQERARAAEADNVAIIGHYPPSFQAEASFRNLYLQDAPAVRKPDLKVFNFYGHTHLQECQGSAAGSCVEFMTGGSGGCCSPRDVPAGF